MTTTEITKQENKLLIKKQYSQIAETLFDAWTQADKLKNWMGPASVVVDNCETSPQRDGKFMIEMKNTEDQSIHTTRGKYLIFDRPNKVQMSFKWDMPDAVETILTVEFKSNDRGTELILTHEKLRNEESRDQHAHGWEGSLEKLSKIL
jgi:uncharacterized protein YndB with AHSA1/START domain